MTNGDDTVVAAAVSGLTPATTYYYRVEATPDSGTAVTGSVATFTTDSVPVAPSIVVTGVRGSGRVSVFGVAEHMARGTEITPIVSLDGGAQQEGVNIRRINTMGEFTWQRRVADGRSITVEFTGGGATSNALTFSAP